MRKRSRHIYIFIICAVFITALTFPLRDAYAACDAAQEFSDGSFQQSCLDTNGNKYIKLYRNQEEVDLGIAHTEYHFSDANGTSLAFTNKTALNSDGSYTREKYDGATGALERKYTYQMQNGAYIEGIYEQYNDNLTTMSSVSGGLVSAKDDGTKSVQQVSLVNNNQQFISYYYDADGKLTSIDIYDVTNSRIDVDENGAYSVTGNLPSNINAGDIVRSNINIIRNSDASALLNISTPYSLPDNSTPFTFSGNEASRNYIRDGNDVAILVFESASANGVTHMMTKRYECPNGVCPSSTEGLTYTMVSTIVQDNNSNIVTTYNYDTNGNIISTTTLNTVTGATTTVMNITSGAAPGSMISTASTGSQYSTVSHSISSSVTQQCITLPGMINAVVSCVELIIYHVVDNNVGNVQDMMKDITSLIITLYMVFFTLRLALIGGVKNIGAEIAVTVFTAVIFIFFVQQSGIEFALDTFFAFQRELMDAVSGALGDTSMCGFDRIWEQVDCTIIHIFGMYPPIGANLAGSAYGAYTSYSIGPSGDFVTLYGSTQGGIILMFNIAVGLLSTAGGLVVFLAVLWIGFIVILSCVEAALIYITALIAVAFFGFIAPLMALAFLFQATRKMCFTYVETVLGNLLLPGLTIGVLALFIYGINIVYAGSLGQLYDIAYDSMKSNALRGQSAMPYRPVVTSRDPTTLLSDPPEVDIGGKLRYKYQLISPKSRNDPCDRYTIQANVGVEADGTNDPRSGNIAIAALHNGSSYNLLSSGTRMAIGCNMNMTPSGGGSSKYINISANGKNAENVRLATNGSFCQGQKSAGRYSETALYISKDLADELHIRHVPTQRANSGYNSPGSGDWMGYVLASDCGSTPSNKNNDPYIGQTVSPGTVSTAFLKLPNFRWDCEAILKKRVSPPATYRTNSGSYNTALMPNAPGDCGFCFYLDSNGSCEFIGQGCIIPDATRGYECPSCTYPYRWFSGATEITGCIRDDYITSCNDTSVQTDVSGNVTGCNNPCGDVNNNCAIIQSCIPNTNGYCPPGTSPTSDGRACTARTGTEQCGDIQGALNNMLLQQLFAMLILVTVLLTFTWSMLSGNGGGVSELFGLGISISKGNGVYWMKRALAKQLWLIPRMFKK